MTIKIPKFSIYGENNPEIQEKIQKTLPWRSWDELNDKEKQIALKQLENYGFLRNFRDNILKTIHLLNHKYFRKLPGENLHHKMSYDIFQNKNLAILDFCNIFLTRNQDMVLFMFSVFADSLVGENYLSQAEKSADNKEKKDCVNKAFKEFDKFKDCLNHIFDQLSINWVLTRDGFIPCQEKEILDQIYIPTLEILSDSKWKLVNDDLKSMFQDYREKKYHETVTKAHSALHRFLQIFLNKEKKNSKGEIGKLFNQAKKEIIISGNIFIEKVVDSIQSFVSSERATNSTAKPALKAATSSDALLMMNVVMIFIQYCLDSR